MHSKAISVIKSTPYVHVLSNRERSKRCDECFTRRDTLQKCAACSTARYCGKTCQRRAWRLHKSECAGFRRVQPRLPLDSTLLMARLVFRHQLGDDRSCKEQTADGQWRSFNDLMSHADDIKCDAKQMEEFAKICYSLKTFMGDDAYSLPIQELLSIFGRMVINTFSICDGEMQPIGSGVYLGASSLDHSCRPNAVAVFNGVELSVRLVRPLTSSDEAVTISYLDQLMEGRERRRRLAEQYYFTCQCAMCLDSKVEGMMAGVRCQSSACGGICVDTAGGLACDRCDRKRSDSDREDREALQQMSLTTLNTLSQLKQCGESQQLLSQAECLLSKQQVLLHDVNVYVCQAFDRALDACIDLAQWPKAAEYCERALTTYRLYYHANHPNIGIQLAKLSKLLAAMDRAEEARQHMEEACSVLAVSHGTEHPLYLECLSLLHSCN